ncbi:MAG: C-GCAxxG-C-C family protein [Thermodesulfobacteriota bacterium]
MQPEEVVERVKKKAKNLFKTGLNCAECVLEAVLAEVDTGLPLASMCLMTGFGAGMGHFGDTCGALVGGIAALGAVYGRREIPVSPKASEEQMLGTPGLYKLFNRLPNEFKKRFGSTQCRLLTAQWRKNWLCRDHIQFCRNLVIHMAGLAAEMAVPQDLARWGSEPFREKHP